MPLDLSRAARAGCTALRQHLRVATDMQLHQSGGHVQKEVCVQMIGRLGEEKRVAGPGAGVSEEFPNGCSGPAVSVSVVDNVVPRDPMRPGFFTSHVVAAEKGVHDVVLELGRVAFAGEDVKLRQEGVFIVALLVLAASSVGRRASIQLLGVDVLGDGGEELVIYGSTERLEDDRLRRCSLGLERLELRKPSNDVEPMEDALSSAVGQCDDVAGAAIH